MVCGASFDCFRSPDALRLCGPLDQAKLGQRGHAVVKSDLLDDLAVDDFLVGGLPAATGRKMHFTGTTVLKVINGKIVQEIGLDDGVTALTQLGLIKRAA